MADQAPRQFDALAAIYDATREPMRAETVDRVSGTLRGRGVRSVLEVGVGTGRVAVPLAQRGFALTGLDAARNMLLRAREKGLSSLAQGSAYRLPFRENAFDLTLFVHVLHMFGDPRRAIAEGIRVARRGACALVRPAPEGVSDAGQEGDVWLAVYRVLEQAGYPTPGTRQGGPVLERRILAQLPPTDVVLLTDRTVTEPYSRILDFVERGGSRALTHIPASAVRDAVAKVRVEFGERSHTYREVEALAFWTDLGAVKMTARDIPK